MPKVSLAPHQLVTLFQPFTHFAMLGGVASGKTYTGAHFAIDMIRKYPKLAGFIGANTYDQLSQATLKELFYWLDEYGYEYISDRKPPPHWDVPYTLKTYKNTLIVKQKNTTEATLIFTRVLQKGDKLRGIEFSWYWIDETRDTPRNTHDIIMSRLRESSLIRGLVTSSTNGRDWVFDRFVVNSAKSRLFGSMHVKTEEAVKAGIITNEFYQSLRETYSPLMAAQELDAQHVNTASGRAYYAASERNRSRRAPWGDTHPDPSRPLIVGCDFNYQPAPCVWMVGQAGPGNYDQHVHWFDEISGVEQSTVDMATVLGNRYSEYFLKIYGDASGGKGTTSNAGEHDYFQINNALSDLGCQFSIDYDQANPLVKNRVENMNRKFCNAKNEVTMTYNPDKCPLFDLDVNVVGWKEIKTGTSGKGKLDNGGNKNATHATDAGGYAMWKLFPPIRRMNIVETVQSSVRAEYGLQK